MVRPLTPTHRAELLRLLPFLISISERLGDETVLGLGDMRSPFSPT
ncbi:hypothetical protein BN159_p21 (plasmid) [Streptomyces davaonensis JCM 4913]|uniref:Uncharacterized protein n=1 Tax=Streptomyces davaonensis (strain DSM 101723 / JCM 4913 / KCC S-0913 / 768) TaxID=1214101 RepID=K4R9F8_STRDJ|nr:hypothetical protein BN159_p21 [Streptomyces davaonensis JCM 4913]